MFGSGVLNEIWITDLSSALVGMLFCHQACCLLYYLGENNSGIHMYQFTFEPLYFCFQMWLWFRIWTKISADRLIWRKKGIGGFAYPYSSPSLNITLIKKQNHVIESTAYKASNLNQSCAVIKYTWYIARPWIKHFHWSILLLLLATPTTQFSFDCKRRRHEQNQCSASDSVGLIFTRSYRSTFLITTPTTTLSLVKTSL